MPQTQRPTDSNGGDQPQPWDRLPDESSRAYHAFCAYRDAGPLRKMDMVWRTYQVGLGRVVPEQNRRCSSQWWEWYRRHEWKQRCTQYDLYLELAARRARETEHQSKVGAHLERQRQISVALHGVALRMLKIADQELQKVPAPGETPGSHTLQANRLPFYARVAGNLARLAGEAEANALGVDELMGVLNESETEIG